MSALPFAALAPHWLRPFWLFALLALPLLWWMLRRHARIDTPWRRAVDPHLLPSLLEDAAASTQRGVWLFAAVYVLSVLALAGPSWRQQPAPLYAPAAPMVVALDLSSHMLAADLQPSRLLRARLKIEQLIAQRKGGQLGLVAYAGDAFTVAPLSDDAGSLRDLLAALAPDTMPVDGQRADRAIHRAADLLSHAGFAHGRILLFTDGVDAAAQTAARDTLLQGYTVDAIGVGTTAGAPLPSSDGTFSQDINGAMQLAHLDANALRVLAQAGGGRYVALRSDANDLAALGVLDSQSDTAEHTGNSDALRWRDDGPLLLLALLPLVALGFRRGWLAVALLAVLAMPVQRVEAAEANWWNSLWQRADQRADHALRTGDATAANALAQTPEQRAAAAYLSNDFATAARQWTALDTADAHYNRGNALVQMKQYPQAIAAYQRALQLRPDMVDAKANLELVKRMQQQQQKQQQKDEQQQDHQGHEQPRQGQQPDQQQQSKSKQQQQQNQHSTDESRQAQKQPDQNQQDQAQQAQQGQGRQSRDQQQPAPDQAKQAQADADERRALDQALRKANPTGKNEQHGATTVKETAQQREKREAIEALLLRVPDDPGGLLRRKFALDYARRQQEGDK
jgi:Ca-activated chloride channel family protein